MVQEQKTGNLVIENFFYNDTFYPELDYLMQDFEIDENELPDLPDDWEIEVEETSKEKIFVLTKEFIVDHILTATDNWEDRFPEDDDNTFKQIEKAIIAGIDIDKINDLLPSLYYVNGKKYIITKNDLINWCK